MGSKIPKVAMARAAKAKAAKAKSSKADATKPTATKPIPSEVSIEPPTRTTPSLPSNPPPAYANARLPLPTWNGQGGCPLTCSKRAATETLSRAAMGPEIVAQLEKWAKLKEEKFYDAEEEEKVIGQLGMLLEEKIAKMDKSVEGLKERIASLMEEIKARLL